MLTDTFTEDSLGAELAALRGFAHLLGSLDVSETTPGEDAMHDIGTLAVVLVGVLDRKVHAVERLYLKQVQEATEALSEGRLTERDLEMVM